MSSVKRTKLQHKICSRMLTIIMRSINDGETAGMVNSWKEILKASGNISISSL